MLIHYTVLFTENAFYYKQRRKNGDFSNTLFNFSKEKNVQNGQFFLIFISSCPADQDPSSTYRIQSGRTLGIPKGLRGESKKNGENQLSALVEKQASS